ncbi:MAG: hypothetical protein PHD57_09425 [Desulfobacterales bacterium]|nr:hypothetical protein [Desulfobacterales bacterium]
MDSLCRCRVHDGLAAGCAGFSNFGDTSLPENIYLRTAGKYQSARVGIFRFDSVVDAPRAGGRAADMLYKQLLKDRVFQEFYTEFSGEYPLTLEDRLRVARGKGYDLIIRGRVQSFLEGGMLQSSQVDEAMAVYDAASGKMLWYAEAFEAGDPVMDADHIFWSARARRAPSTRMLMERNSRKFSCLLKTDSR